jgi:hypothetical protein
MRPKLLIESLPQPRSALELPASVLVAGNSSVRFRTKTSADPHTGSQQATDCFAGRSICRCVRRAENQEILGVAARR